MRTKRPRRHLLPALALIVIAGLAAGCSSGDARGDAGPQATVATAPSTTTTTAPADPYAVPDDASKIDADYVNRVLAALNHIRGDLARKQLATGQLSEADLIPLRALYSDSELPIQAQIVVKSVVPPRERLRDPVGDPRMVIDHFLTRRATCVSAVVAYDFDDVLVDAGGPRVPWFVALVPKNPANDPGAINPTPWVLGYDSNEEADECAI